MNQNLYNLITILACLLSIFSLGIFLGLITSTQLRVSVKGSPKAFIIGILFFFLIISSYVMNSFYKSLSTS